MREALFSMLASDGLGAPERVLDLYAGSGALAFEALSRGASAAVLVEHARDAVAAIRDNARALGAEDRVQIVATKVERALEHLDGVFGLVFADPPYVEVGSPGFADVLAAAARRLAPEGALVLEHGSADTAPVVAGLDRDRSRRHGDTTLTLYFKSPEQPGGLSSG